MRVINKYKATPEERLVAKYIGRPSVLQNPYPITDTCDRDTSVKLFRVYFIGEILKRNPQILQALSELKEEDLLMCYCHPKACHGDTVKEIWSFFHRNGGVTAGMDLFTWVYGDEHRKGATMSTNIQKLLVLEHPSHDTLDDTEKGISLYRVHLARQLMTRDPAVENAFREVINNPSELAIVPMTPYEAEKVKIVTEFVKEFRDDDSDYERAVHHFKNKHNHEKIDFNPEDDGVTHINVYSKGKTELGRLLSNFGHTPFKHPIHGWFSSVEAFWYWLSLGKNEDKLRTLHGFQAKKEGLAIREIIEKNGNKASKVENFKAEIKKAILCKIEQNDRLNSLLKNSTLPLTHYYVWGNGSDYRITYPENYAWIHEYISDVRDYLNGKAHKLVIAGSRTIDNLDLVRGCYTGLGIKVIEFISGTANGPDKACIEIAKEREIPCLLMPADWDTHKKSAGYIRNEEMSKIATFGLIIWDGTSNGTKHMAERCQAQGIPYKVIQTLPPSKKK